MQTSVDTYLSEAFAGMKADTNFDDVLSRKAGEDIDFGLGVVETSTEEESKLPSASGQYFDGVALHTHTKELDSSDERKYSEKDSMSVLRRGRVWVISEDAVSIGDDVYLRHTTNGSNTPGNFRTDNDSGNAMQVKGCKWLTETSSTNELALLEIRNYYQ
jgi:hypothetical protein